jgi:cation/acetate symporter
MYGGLLTALVLIVFSPVVSGGLTPMIPGVDFHWFPLNNPGIISIPAGFLFGIIGTLTGKAEKPELEAEMRVRALTGHGAEKATPH